MENQTNNSDTRIAGAGANDLQVVRLVNAKPVSKETPPSLHPAPVPSETARKVDETMHNPEDDGPLYDETHVEEYCSRSECGRAILHDEPRTRYSPGYVICDDCTNLLNCYS